MPLKRPRRALSLDDISDLTSQKELIFNELLTECEESDKLSFLMREKLQRFPLEERREIVSRCNCAPLFTACAYGNIEAVKYIIKHCDADIEERGKSPLSVPRGYRSHYTATNLWWASLRGTYNVVKCLVELGADVNSVLLNTGDTCILTACSFSYYKVAVYLVQHNADISKPNKNGVTCLMSSLGSVPICQLLIDHGAELNAQDNESKTALHHAIEEHNFKITKLLLENGADSLLKNKHADDALQTACFCDNKSAFEYLIEKYSYSKERIAQAYELVGSTVLEESGNIIETLNHWRTALSLRNEDPNNYLVKKTAPQKASNPTVTEFSSEEELDIFALDMDAMKMQSLLVRERILGPFHRNTVSSLRNLWEFSVKCFNLQKCLDLFPYFLELCFEGPLRTMIFGVEVLMESFHHFYVKHINVTLSEHMQFSDAYELLLMFTSKFALYKESKISLYTESSNKTSIRKKHQFCYSELMKIVSYLYYITYLTPKTSQETAALEQILHQLLCINPRTFSNDTILHFVVSRCTWMYHLNMYTFPDVEITELLLQCGANVKAVNCCLNTPLHLAAEARNYNPAIFNALLRHGAHADQKNKAGKTPFDVVKEADNFPLNPFRYTTLKCLAARKIMEKQVPFSGKVPAEIESFIKIH